MKITRATERWTSCHVPRNKGVCGMTASYWIETHTGLDDPNNQTVSVPMCEKHAAFFASEERLKAVPQAKAKRTKAAA